MSIEFYTSLDLDLVYSRWFDTVDLVQFRQTFHLYLTDAHYRPGRTELVDFTDVVHVDADFRKIWAGLRIVNAHGPSRKLHTRTVIIAPGDVIYGLSRMYQTLAENAQGIRVEVYRDEAAALEALALPFGTIRQMRARGRFRPYTPRPAQDA